MNFYMIKKLILQVKWLYHFIVHYFNVYYYYYNINNINYLIMIIYV